MTKPVKVKRIAVLFNDGSMNVYSDRGTRAHRLRMARDECADANYNVKLVRDRAQVVEIDGQLVTTVLP